MADIYPFRAIRYSQRELSRLVAPPYDILDEPDKRALLAKDAHNIVAVDLPHTPPKEAGPDSVYAAAAATLAGWQQDGTLRQDAAPAIYAYHQHFKVDGVERVRRKFFARLHLEEFGAGKVFPHEQTFGGPKEDRLRLTRATRCNLSPIFGLYTDPPGAVAEALAAVTTRQPDASAVADGVDNRLWVVADPAVIERVRGLLADKAIFIADGHHRYGTALNYRRELIQHHRTLPATHPANSVLCVFCAMEDPGAIILPTHRVLVDLPGLGERLGDALSERFSMTASAATDGAAFVAELARGGPQAIGLFSGATGRFALLRPKQADCLAELEPHRAAAWRGLSYAILHRAIIDEVITPRLAGGKPPTIHYVKPLPDTLAEARQSRGAAFIMQACTMGELRAVCTAGELMPQKTTYFFPKLATGMVLSPLHD
ncbi:MAG: DUF1015 domain-containing protein [Phycisphaerae bacterium]